MSNNAMGFGIGAAGPKGDAGAAGAAGAGFAAAATVSTIDTDSGNMAVATITAFHQGWVHVVGGSESGGATYHIPVTAVRNGGSIDIVAGTPLTATIGTDGAAILAAAVVTLTDAGSGVLHVHVVGADTFNLDWRAVAALA